MPTPLSGKRGRVVVNGTNLSVEYFRVKPHSDMLPATTFEDCVDEDNETDATANTFEVSLAGMTACDISIRGYVDSDLLPNVAGFIDGSTISDVYLFIDKRNNERYWNFPIVIVQDVEWTGEVKGRMEFTATLKSQGWFGPPS